MSLNPSFVKVVESIPSDADRLGTLSSLVRLSPGQYALVELPGYSTVGSVETFAKRTFGMGMNRGFTADPKYAGSVGILRREDGKTLGYFASEELSMVTTLFLARHYAMASEIIAMYGSDLHAYLIPEVTCTKFDIRPGERVSLFVDPTVKPSRLLPRDNDFGPSGQFDAPTNPVTNIPELGI